MSSKPDALSPHPPDILHSCGFQVLSGPGPNRIDRSSFLSFRKFSFGSVEFPPLRLGSTAWALPGRRGFVWAASEGREGSEKNKTDDEEKANETPDEDPVLLVVDRLCNSHSLSDWLLWRQSKTKPVTRLPTQKGTFPLV